MAGDLQAATVSACQMIGQLGMGTSLVSSSAMEYPAGGIVSKVLSNDGGRAEVEELLSASKASVTQMLDDHRSVVEALRDALLEREELIGDEILAVIRGSQGTWRAARRAAGSTALVGSGTPVGATAVTLPDPVPAVGAARRSGVLGAAAAAAPEHHLDGVDGHPVALGPGQRQAVGAPGLDVEGQAAPLAHEVMVVGPDLRVVPGGAVGQPDLADLAHGRRAR